MSKLLLIFSVCVVIIFPLRNKVNPYKFGIDFSLFYLNYGLEIIEWVLDLNLDLEIFIESIAPRVIIAANEKRIYHYRFRYFLEKDDAYTVVSDRNVIIDIPKEYLPSN